eukprot:3936023-Rhodomonas_salina.1
MNWFALSVYVYRRRLPRIFHPVYLGTCMKNMQSVVGPRVVRVLFTGGPNGGKTSILEYLRAKFKQSRPGLKVICVPETATALLGIMGDDVKSAIVEG